jgi:hypothetical protein
MKYLGLLFLILSGCTTTTKSEYWQGCVDTVTILHIDMENDAKDYFCDAMNEHYREELEKERFLKEERK